MNKLFISTLNPDGLSEHLKGLTSESDNLGEWAKLATGPHGRFLIKELEANLESVRSMYSKIPVSHELAGVMLAGLQGKEENITSILTRLKDSQLYKKTLDEEIDYALQCLKSKKDETSRNISRVVAHEAVLESERNG